MNKFTRFVAILGVLIMLMSVGFGVVVAQDEDVLVIGWEQEPSQLTPIGSMVFGTLVSNFYGRDLWDWDVNREIFPIMAAEIPSFENGMVRTLENGNTQVEYHLNQGMLWSDGEAVTSADCAFYHELQMNPSYAAIQRGTYPEVVESFEVVDDYTFVMTYNTPWPDYTSQNTANCLLPEHVLRPVLEAEGTIDNAGYFKGENVVGYGPYVLKEWRTGEAIELEVNPLWGTNSWEKVPAYERVILRFITESAQMQNALEVGDIDLAFNWSADLVDSYSAIDGVEIISTPGVFGDAVWVNVGNGGHPALADKNVVRGMIHAIDRVTLAEELIGPGTEVPKSWFSSIFWPEDLPFIEYDVDEANRLLDESGWVDTNGNGVRDKDGMELVLQFYTTSGNTLRESYQVFIQDYLSQVGVRTNLLPIPSGSLFAIYPERGILSTGGFDLAIFALSTSALSPFADAPEWFGCGGIGSPENSSGRNGWGFCSPEFDEADALVGVTVDPEERLAYSHQAQHAFFEGYHWHGLYLRQTWYAFDSTKINTATVRDLGTLSANYLNKIEYWEPA